MLKFLKNLVKQIASSPSPATCSCPHHNQPKPEKTPYQKELDQLEEQVKAVPEGAQGVGFAYVRTDGKYERVPITSKKQALELIADARTKENLFLGSAPTAPSTEP